MVNTTRQSVSKWENGSSIPSTENKSESVFHGKDGCVSQEYVAKYDGVNNWWYNHNL